MRLAAWTTALELQPVNLSMRRIPARGGRGLTSCDQSCTGHLLPVLQYVRGCSGEFQQQTSILIPCPNPFERGGGASLPAPLKAPAAQYATGAHVSAGLHPSVCSLQRLGHDCGAGAASGARALRGDIERCLSAAFPWRGSMVAAGCLRLAGAPLGSVHGLHGLRLASCLHSNQSAHSRRAMCRCRQLYPNHHPFCVGPSGRFSSRQCMHTQALLLHLLTERSQGAASFCAPYLVRLPDQVLSAIGRDRLHLHSRFPLHLHNTHLCIVSYNLLR